MKTRLLLSMMLGLAAVCGPGHAFAAWSKGFVVDYYAAPGWKAGDKDSNCPNGDAPAPDWVKVMTTSWRTEEVARRLVTNAAVGGVPLGNRGPRPNQNVYRDPTLVADPMTPTVVGNTGYGFDLDGNSQTGFVSPDGKERGLDNQAYRAVGCMNQFRGGSRAEPRADVDYEMAEMRAGVFTVVIVLSGEGNDPMNDPSVRVGMYLSKDKLGIDSNGAVSADDSYRIDPDPRFTTVFDAKSVGGVITPRAPLERVRLREPGARGGFGQDLVLEKPQARLTLKADGTLFAEIGGYRNWRAMYEGMAAAGAAAEQPAGVLYSALWYNWQKLADWKPAGVAGPNTHISVFYTMDAVPAFVITPDSHQVVTRADLFSGVSQAASRTPEETARIMRLVGADPGFRLTGGARSWPNPPDPNESLPNDPLYWAKAIQDPRGSYYATGLASPAEPPPATAASPGGLASNGR